jgi:ribA/ribD-fused uncharacterized protein
MEKIENFNAPFEFLSNFYPCFINYRGINYSNSEAAYQAQKCPEQAYRFVGLSGAQAKKLGREIPMRSDWDAVKLEVMSEIVEAKFTQNEGLGKLLLLTGDMEIIEGNYWGDIFWGVCTNRKYDHVGENHLGKILMEVRNKLKGERQYGNGGN